MLLYAVEIQYHALVYAEDMEDAKAVAYTNRREITSNETQDFIVRNADERHLRSWDGLPYSNTSEQRTARQIWDEEVAPARERTKEKADFEAHPALPMEVTT